MAFATDKSSDSSNNEIRVRANQYKRAAQKASLTIVGGSCHKYHFCCDKSFVATNTSLSRQNTTKVQTRVFVETKMILVAAPANDT